MSDEPVIEYRDFGLKALLRALTKTPPRARVGILGTKTNRKDGTKQTNASIGLKHEIGDEVPMRSFLRQPLMEHYQEFLDKAGLSEKTIKEVIASGDLVGFLKKLGIVGEAVVIEAFHTGGFGKWKPSNMLYKKNQQTLVETKQLRESITSDVK